MDRPGALKSQTTPIPYLGGVGVFAGVASGPSPGTGRPGAPGAAPALGICDDRFDLPPLPRLAGEVGIGVAVLLTSPLHLPGAVAVLVVVPVTVLLINGVNLLDGLDMLAAGTAVAAVGSRSCSTDRAGCGPRRWPAPSSGSWPTTVPRPGSTWATAGPTCWAPPSPCCWPRLGAPAAPAVGAAASPWWRFPPPRWPSPWCAGAGPPVAAVRRPRPSLRSLGAAGLAPTGRQSGVHRRAGRADPGRGGRRTPLPADRRPGRRPLRGDRARRPGLDHRRPHPRPGGPPVTRIYLSPPEVGAEGAACSSTPSTPTGSPPSAPTSTPSRPSWPSGWCRPRRRPVQRHGRPPPGPAAPRRRARRRGAGARRSPSWPRPPPCHLGARPVFVDCAPDTWTIDPDLVADELDRRAGTAACPPRW